MFLLSLIMVALCIYLFDETYTKVERDRDMRYLEDIVNSLDVVAGELGYTLCGWVVSDERYHINNLDMHAARVIAKDIGGIAIHLTYNDDVDDIAFVDTADEGMKEWILNYFVDKNVINTLIWNDSQKYPPYFVTLPDGRVCRIGFAHVNYWSLVSMPNVRQRQDFLATNKNNGCIVLSLLDDY